MDPHPPPDAGEFRFRWDDFPPLTAELPGCGGRIRVEPDDFQVTELPAYEPSGAGSHLYLWVEKRERTTRELVQALQAAGLREKEVGVAGLKDKHAVTRQWLSIPNRHAEAAEALDALPGVRVLQRSRHRNKLGVGHLRGNRFELRIRDPHPDGAARARAVLAELARLGAPNYFGPQRFGRFGANALDGVRLVRGERVPGGHRLKRFFLSALQSLLFNTLLAERLARGCYATVLVGDWAKKHDTGGEFEVRDAAEAERAARLEISATLPLYGTRVRPSAGEPGAMERRVLERFGLRWSDFTARRGDRRVSRLLLDEVALETLSEGLRLRFALPKGAYATTVLREVMKVEVDAPLERAPDDPSGPDSDPDPDADADDLEG